MTLTISDESLALLTHQEQVRLTIYKMKYDLMSKGFSQDEIEHLCFLKWLHERKRIWVL